MPEDLISRQRLATDVRDDLRHDRERSQEDLWP